MLNELSFFTGPLDFKLTFKGGTSFWSTWKWKLDPYIVKSVKESYDISISMIPFGSQIQVDKLLREEKVGFFSHRVYAAENDDLIWRYERIKNGDIVLSYLIKSSCGEIKLLEDNSNTNGILAFEYLGQIIPYFSAAFDVLSFHGVLMEYEDSGIIISAASGTGKTTHARMWRDIHKALIINGDRSTCKKVNGRWTGFGLPWSGTSGEQINRSVPIKAMVILVRGEENSTKRLTGLDAFIEVMPNMLYSGWDAEMTGKAIDLLDDFLSDIPVIKLYCRPDEEAVAVLKSALENL